jgi:hypothetical protein
MPKPSDGAKKEAERNQTGSTPIAHLRYWRDLRCANISRRAILVLPHSIRSGVGAMFSLPISAATPSLSHSSGLRVRSSATQKPVRTPDSRDLDRVEVLGG